MNNPHSRLEKIEKEREIIVMTALIYTVVGLATTLVAFGYIAVSSFL